jgi:hypothetical protein
MIVVTLLLFVLRIVGSAQDLDALVEEEKRPQLLYSFQCRSDAYLIVWAPQHGQQTSVTTDAILLRYLFHAS